MADGMMLPTTVASLEVQIYETGAEKTQSAIKGVQQTLDTSSKGMNRFGGLMSKLKGITDKYTNSLSFLGKRFKNYLQFRLMRTAVTMLTTALKDGISSAYKYSQAFGTDFASSMDKLATSYEYLKNSIGAMIAPIVNALQPAISWLLESLGKVANTIGSIIAYITGQDSALQAVKYMKKYDESTKSATKSVKELKRQLMGFDELNILSKNVTSAGTSSSSSSSTPKGFTINELKGVVETSTKSLGNDWNETINKIKDQLGVVLNDIKRGIDTGVQAFATKFSSWTDRVSDTFFPSWREHAEKVRELLRATYKNQDEKLADLKKEIAKKKQLNVENLKLKRNPDGYSFAGVIHAETKASGGFVDSGQLFIAREAGAEMVGAIGNRTAVANNDQIVEGIKRGVMEALAMSNNSQLVIPVQLDGKKIGEAVVEYNNGLVLRTGKSPLMI